VKPGQTLLIDDNLRNVKAMDELGILSIHFQNPKRLKKELLSHKFIVKKMDEESL
jgi:2-haloacid dehalogenase